MPVITTVPFPVPTLPYVRPPLPPIAPPSVSVEPLVVKMVPPVLVVLILREELKLVSACKVAPLSMAIPPVAAPRLASVCTNRFAPLM
ncbi:hypothetical protein DP49_5688 [Burkholderia pseudomallei]|nr:hypothetical protein DP49_5688 [Burkholderia pseudomallei]